MTERETRVLIVEDNESFCWTLSMILKKKGYEVVTVENGQSAIEAAKGTCFDMIFLDLLMPGKNGLETIREIKEQSPQTKMVLMTGQRIDGLDSDPNLASVDGLLQKPFDVDVMIDMLSSHEMLRYCEERVNVILDRLASLMDRASVVTVFRESVSGFIDGEVVLTGVIEVSERGVSMDWARYQANLRRRESAVAGSTELLRSRLRGLYSAVYDRLGTVAGSALSDSALKAIWDTLDDGELEG